MKWLLSIGGGLTLGIITGWCAYGLLCLSGRWYYWWGLSLALCGTLLLLWWEWPR